MAELLGNGRLGQLAGDLLADAAFVFAEASESFSPKGGALFLARIALKCGQGWELIVVAESELAKALAANLLGLDDDAEEAQTSSSDALAEWTNILAGSVALECAADGEPCRIGIPVVSSEAIARANTCLGKAFRRANLITESGHHLAVGLRPLEAA